MTDALPPPGWYDDPAGAHGSRWWDGTSWTDHVREQPPGDDPPPVPASAAPGVPLGSRRDRRVGIAVAAVILVGLIATTAIGLRSAVVGDEDTGLGRVLEGADVPAPLSRDEVADRFEAAGCRTVVDGQPLEDRNHLDRDAAPPPAALYPDRPAHSGRHYGTLLPLPAGTATVPIDERAVLHNMEHGSVVVWFAPAALATDTVAALSAWRDERDLLGFTSAQGGAVFASPMPELDDPPGVALRAWGVAVDCEGFDPLVADAFLVEHWGDHGIAPERNLAPYPEDSLELRDRA